MSTMGDADSELDLNEYEDFDSDAVGSEAESRSVDEATTSVPPSVVPHDGPADGAVLSASNPDPQSLAQESRRQTQHTDGRTPRRLLDLPADILNLIINEV